MPTIIEHNPNRLLQEALHLNSAAGKLARLVESVRELISAGEFDATQAILEQKQPFLDELKKLPALRESHRRCSELFPPEQCEQLNAAIEVLEASLRSLTKAEAEIIELIDIRKQQTANELRKMSQHRQASKCYSPKELQQPKSRIDISG